MQNTTSSGNISLVIDIEGGKRSTFVIISLDRSIYRASGLRQQS